MDWEYEEVPKMTITTERAGSGSGNGTREEGNCRSKRLPDIVIHFWTDRADHDIRLDSNSAKTLSTCSDTTPSSSPISTTTHSW
jgi:hypothetical protein